MPLIPRRRRGEMEEGVGVRVVLGKRVTVGRPDDFG